MNEVSTNNKAKTLRGYLDNPGVKARLNEVLGKNASAFASALITVYNSNRQLQECTLRSIMGAAVLAATVNLSINPALGHAYLVPYKGQCTLQVGYKGMIQLAHRTGKYERLHAGPIHEGEIRGFEPLTGDPIIGEKLSDTVIGYAAYMRLNNGFEKVVYMTTAEIEEHALKYSTSYRYDRKNNGSTSIWTKNYESMACKTVMRRLLTKWGVLSIEMAKALQGDQTVVDKNTVTYVDGSGQTQERLEDDLLNIDPETGEVLTEEKS